MSYLPCFWLRGGAALVQAFIPLNVCISHLPVCKRELFGSFPLASLEPGGPHVGESPQRQRWSIYPCLPLPVVMGEAVGFGGGGKEVG